MSQSLISPIWSRASGHATVYRLAQRASGAVRGHSPAYRAAKRPSPVTVRVPLGSVAAAVLGDHGPLNNPETLVYHSTVFPTRMGS